MQLSGDPSERARAAVELVADIARAALPPLERLALTDADLGAARRRAERGRAHRIVPAWRELTGYLNGLSLASVLLIMSLGLAITFGLMGIINMAHGEMLMVGCLHGVRDAGALRAALAAAPDYYFVAALPLSILVAGAVGLLLERGLMRFLYGRPLETLLVTWGAGDGAAAERPSLVRRPDERELPPRWLSGAAWR